MNEKHFLNIGLETTKGAALHGLKDEGSAGAYDFATLDLTGVVADQETFTLGSDGTNNDGDVYEINEVLTDTGSESVAQVEVGDTSFVLDVAPSIEPLPGDVVRMESEFMIVINWNPNGLNLNVLRGQFGSTEAQHTIANSDLFQAAQPVADGNFAVPVDAVTASTAKAQIADAVTFWNTGYSKGLGGGIGVKVQNGLKVVAIVGSGTDDVVFAYAANGGVADTAETMTNATITAFADGVEPASQRYAEVVVADDGSAFSLFAPFDVSAASVTTYGADGALVEASDLTAQVTNLRLVDVAGTFSAGQTLVVGMYE